MNSIKLKKAKLSDLKFNPKNPRKHDAGIEQIAESIKKHQYITPIVVNSDNLILSGEGRLQALKLLGITEAEVIVANVNIEEDFLISDNLTRDLTLWTKELDAELKLFSERLEEDDSTRKTVEVVTKITQEKYKKVEAELKTRYTKKAIAKTERLIEVKCKHCGETIYVNREHLH